MRKDPRVQAQEIGDMETLRSEQRKRNEWQWENALRRHNFVGFIGELTKGVVRDKLKEGDKAYDAWVDGAKAKTKARMEERRRKGATADEMDI